MAPVARVSRVVGETAPRRPGAPPAAPSRPSARSTAAAAVPPRPNPACRHPALPGRCGRTGRPRLRPVTRSYTIRTYGCQMNVHDSERMAGLLEEAGYVRADPDGAGRRRVQHLRGPGERRQPALRQPRPPAAGQDGPAGHADRRRRLPGPEGPGRDRPPGAVGGRGVRHPQRARAAGAAGAGPAQRGRPGGDRRVAGGVPVDAAGAARVGLRRLGVDLGGLQQHLHVLHRARRCAAPRRTAGPATCSPRWPRWPRTGCWR